MASAPKSPGGSQPPRCEGVEQDDLVALAGQPQARQRHAGAPGDQAVAVGAEAHQHASAPGERAAADVSEQGRVGGHDEGSRSQRLEVMVLHFVRFRPMSTTPPPGPPILATLIGRLAAAVPGRARATFTELLIGAAVTRGGHVTDAILAVGLSRSWTTYYWLLERGRWSWLAVWRALLGVLEGLFAPPVWHVVVDNTVVERISAGPPA